MSTAAEMIIEASSDRRILAATRRWCVLYRVGGTARFQWRRVLRAYVGQSGLTAAAETARGLRRMGYLAVVEDVGVSALLGPPTTYAYDQLRRTV